MQDLTCELADKSDAYAGIEFDASWHLFKASLQKVVIGDSWQCIICIVRFPILCSSQPFHAKIPQPRVYIRGRLKLCRPNQIWAR